MEIESRSLKGVKVLMVGAGGIGCELLKTLALSGFEDIHVIDVDTIEVSNLNRQFLFHQWHVGQAKAKVARDAVMKFRPNVNITPYHANVLDRAFNVEFFKQFNVVMNGLDNLDARRHVNRLCLAAGVPLIESGTTGFLGQVTVHVKGQTECYECQPKPTQKTYPVCTITSTPSKFVHCVVWAKDLLFAKLFGDKSQENDINARSGNADEQNDDVFEQRLNEHLDEYCRRIYDHVFGYNVEAVLANREMWKNRNQPQPIYLKDVLPLQEIAENGYPDHASATEMSSISAMRMRELENSQEIWSLLKNSKVFLVALKSFMKERVKEIGCLTFDKEDQLAVEFVTAAANIRATSFGIPQHSLFEVKGIAGNIVHAVATTNAVVAGLIVIEAIKVLQGDADNYRMTYCVKHPLKRMLLMPVKPFEPNTSCYICSETPVVLEINTGRAKLRDFVDKIIRSKFGMSYPMVMVGSTLVYEAGDDLEDDVIANYAANLDKVLTELPAPIMSGTIVNVEDFQQELSCSVNIKHRIEFDENDVDGFVLVGWTPSIVEKEDRVIVGTDSTSTIADGFGVEGGTIDLEANQADRAIIGGGKRKHPEVLYADNPHASCTIAANGSKRKHSEVLHVNHVNASVQGAFNEVLAEMKEEDDDIVLLVENPELAKKQRPGV